MENKFASSPAAIASQQQRFREGIALFNRGEFFECHEVLEAVWLEASGDDRLFLQGLIQVAVAFHHLRRGNFAGSHRLLRAGVDKLSRFTAESSPINTAEVLQILAPLPDQIEAGQLPQDFPAPELRWTTAP